MIINNMIRFQRRNMGCWDVCDDVDRDKLIIPILEFNSVYELINYIHETLPFTQDESEYKVRIKDDVVVW